MQNQAGLKEQFKYLFTTIKDYFRQSGSLASGKGRRELVMVVEISGSMVIRQVNYQAQGKAKPARGAMILVAMNPCDWTCRGQVIFKHPWVACPESENGQAGC
ncbi:hypothetical protein ILYODFUR_030590 [Ilyodon furcidens]|uniref:Uncharacterized protein n=1 Tax=Ilyodon furcidens TaxID=33524 RepID=A0ABV0SRI1_9TELE